MGLERQPLLPPVLIELLLIGDNTGQVLYGRMQRKFAGFAGTQLVEDC
ncbi:MAG TPA: hypothetical protein VFX56_07905 [Nitrospira sp.]|nr:hypothetical protein [Nitrospira sp.]